MKFYRFAFLAQIIQSNWLVGLLTNEYVELKPFIDTPNQDLALNMVLFALLFLWKIKTILICGAWTLMESILPGKSSTDPNLEMEMNPICFPWWAFCQLVIALLLLMREERGLIPCYCTASLYTRSTWYYQYVKWISGLVVFGDLFASQFKNVCVLKVFWIEFTKNCIECKNKNCFRIRMQKGLQKQQVQIFT